MRISSATGATISLAAFALLALTGCSGETSMACNADSTYLEARAAEPLRIPDDLSVPDESEALHIPDGMGADGLNEDRDGLCLEASPAFSRTDTD